MNTRKLALLSAVIFGVLAATGALLLCQTVLNGSLTVQAQGPDGYDTYYVVPGGDCGGAWRGDVSG